jgi:hypothetical protein
VVPFPGAGQLHERLGTGAPATLSLEVLREQLKVLRDRNLDEATFEEKMEIIAKLGIMVYPAEDLRSMRVVCQVNLQGAKTENGGYTSVPQPSAETQDSEPERSGRSNASQANGVCGPATGCGKVSFAPPFMSTCKNLQVT